MSFENKKFIDNNYDYNLLSSAIFSISLDVIVTILYFEYESNPIVIELGLTNFVIVKILAMIGLAISWELGAKKYYLAHLLLWFITIFHFVIVITNIIAITFIY